MSKQNVIRIVSYHIMWISLMRKSDPSPTGHQIITKIVSSSEPKDQRVEQRGERRGDPKIDEEVT